jgi:hypothetical protein
MSFPNQKVVNHSPIEQLAEKKREKTILIYQKVKICIYSIVFAMVIRNKYHVKSINIVGLAFRHGEGR